MRVVNAPSFPSIRRRNDISNIILHYHNLVIVWDCRIGKKFAKDFFTKISKFVPLIVAALAIAARIIFDICSAGTPGSFAFVDAVKDGFIIASLEVYTYEGIVKLVKRVIKYVKYLTASTIVSEEIDR